MSNCEINVMETTVSITNQLGNIETISSCCKHSYGDKNGKLTMEKYPVYQIESDVQNLIGL